MLIRYGYEITLSCLQPTALVCLLSVHEDRAADIRVPETTFTTPHVAVSTYRDLFGNRCRRLVAPAGDLTMWGDATIEDDGALDRIVPGAREMPVRVGVCRDFAHLGVTLCRCLNIPARYVNGHLGDIGVRLPIRWISAHGWRSSSMALGIRSNLATMRRGSAGLLSHAAATRPASRSSIPSDHMS